MKKFYIFFISYLCFFTFNVNAQVVNNACESQTPCNAMPICGLNNYAVPFTYTTSAPYNVNPGGAASCNNAVGGVVNFVPNWVYYRFNCFGAGILNFTITPNDPLADMDWAIWDITTTGCGTLNAGNIQACNSYTGGGVTGMQPVAAAGFTGQIALIANHSYILGVSRKSGGLVTTGFILGFAGTTANITDNAQPALASIVPLDVCSNGPINEIKVVLTKPVRCSGIQNTDFAITGNPSFTATGAGCAAGCTGVTGLNYSNITDTVILNFPTPLTPNTYTISLTGAPPAQPFFDICANLADVGPTITFTIPDPLTLTIGSSKNCLTGQYIDTATATFGVGPYQYKIAGPGQTNIYGPATFGSNIFPNLIGGNTYTITVRDVNNCMDSVVVNYPPNLPFNVITYKKNPPCNNQFLLDTFRVVSVSGGVAPFTYSLTSTPAPAAAAANLYSPPASWNNLQPAQYTITVTDSYGCTATATANMPNPAQLVLPTPVSTNPICYGDSTGTITCGAIGGTPPINNYVLNPTYPNVVISGVNNNIFSNLPGGTYTITVTDYNGCTATNTKTLITPSQIVLTTTNTQPTCVNPCGGSISPMSFGGSGAKKYYKYPLVVPPNTYSDSVVVVGGAFTNLCADTYTILAKDVLGCTTTITVNLALPPIPDLTITTINPPLCNGDLGTIITNVTGGTGPYTNLSYSFLPPTGGMNVTASGVGGVIGTYNNVPPGTYNLYIQDVNNCQDSIIGVIMTQPPIISWNAVSGTDISCDGGNDGTINASATGGVGTLVYTISPLGPQTNIIGNFTGLTAQCYTITATDANGCTATITFCLIQPPALNISIANINNISCNGLCDGSAEVTAAGGTPNYTYNLSPLNGNIGLNTGILSNLCSNIIYTITATDANNCTITTTLLLTQPNILAISIVNTSTPTCNPGCDGSATTSVVGGTPSYTYSISGGAAINAIGEASNLCAGTVYSITVTDANGCTGVTTVQLAPPISPTIVIGTTTSPTCTPGCDGTAATSVAGGLAPFTYTISGGATIDPLGNASGLCAGTIYTITVTDANACTADITVQLIAPNSPTLTLGATTDPTCTPGCDGTAMTTTSGGVAPYTYTISGGAVVDPLGNASGLCAGITYTITVTDANACTADVTVLLVAPNSPTLTLGATTDPTCTPGCDGTAMTTTSGGVAPFTYTISGGAVVDPLGNASGLCAGIIYTITVTDANACTADVTVLLVAPNSPTLTLGATTDPTCTPGCDGTAATSVAGGLAPYTYTISGGAVVDPLGNASGLCAGITYTITVTDANACTADVTVQLIAPNSPTLTLGATTDPTCTPGCDGTAATSVAGGLAPFTYTISGGAVVDPLGNASGLCAGTIYTITVTDANACTADVTVLLVAPNSPTLTLGTTTDPTCTPGCDGTAMTTTSGGVAPFTYTISGGATIDPLGNASGLCAGTIYTITVTDANACTADVTVQLIAPNSPTLTLGATTDPTCTPGCDGTAATSVAGGLAPFTYTISGGATIDPLGNASGLCAGTTYTITVSDANGCTADVTVLLVAPNSPTLTLGTTTDPTCTPGCDGTAMTTTSGGVAPFTYTISGGATIDPLGNASGLCAGTIYTITVTDANACTADVTVQLIAPNSPTLMLGATTDPTCTPGCDGTAATSVAGGLAPFTYTISGGATIDPLGNASGLCAGTTYTITVSDANGCTADVTVLLVAPNSPTLTLGATTDPTCTPGCDGTAATSVAGGLAPFTYTISGGATIDPLGNASGLCAGITYTITVTDANACTADVTVLLAAPNSPTLTLGATTDPTCTPGCDGTAMTTTSGGVAPFTYTISGGATIDPLGNASGLCAGTIYTITVTDANSCTADITVQLIAPNSPTLTLGATTDPTCTPGCDGTAMTTTSGGVAPYTYTISGGAVVDPLGNASGLCAGTIYTITVTDANACTADITVQLIAPNSPTLTLGATTDPTCTPGCDGTAMTTTSGGVAPFTYTISGGATIDPLGNASGLCAGITYTITVTDANACTADITVLLVAPNSPTLTLGATTDPTCTPGCDGTAMTTTSGGVAPFTYTISGGAVVDPLGNASGLCAGITYTITVTDANSCTSDVTVQLIAPNSPTLTLGATTDPTCTPGCDGTAMTTTSGGVAPYTYTISGGAVVDPLGNASGLCAGTIYTITVTDANACTADITVLLVAPNSPTLTLGATTDPTCTPGCDGTAATSVAGGLAPYTYTISGGAVVDPLGNASGLCAGTIYTITVTDANSCTSDVTVQLIAPNSPTLTLGATTTPTCTPGCDGTAMTTTSGGVAPFTYTISGGATIDPLGNASGLCSGTIYTITVTDANSCTADVTVQLIAPNSPTLTLGATTTPTCTPGCDGTAMTTTSGGVAPFTYTISGGAVVDALGNASGLCSGTIYTITVSDVNGCTADITVQLIAPNSPTLTLGATTDPTCTPGCDGTAMTTTSGGVAPFTYTISGGAVVDPLGNASGLCAGTIYTITVTDANACTADITVQLIAPNSPTLTLGATTDPTCTPGCDGTAMTTTSGGVAPFTYTISGGAVVDPLGNASGLCAGTIYTITVTDANACTADITVLLIAPNSPTLTLGATTDPTCTPGCDGTAMTTTSGGVAPFTYTISGGAVVDPLGNASGLCAGITYTITVTDANACTADITVQLIAPNSPTLTLGATTDPTCTPGCDGTAMTTTSGGVAPYTYTISGGAVVDALGNASGLCAGIIYTITVTDANACTADITVLLVAPNSPTLTLGATTTPTCTPGCDGTAMTTTSGGVAPYTYTISGGAVVDALGNASGLCAGTTYTITVTDANACTADITVQLIAPNSPTLTLGATTTPTCTPGCDGTAMTTTSGGVAPYTYTISGGAVVDALGNASGLCSGTIYTITVTDANSCTADITVQLIAPNSPTLTLGATTTPTCTPGCDGTAMTTTSGGVAPYTYTISGGAVVDPLGNASGLCSGTIYTITVTDANSCTADITVQLIAPNSPTLTLGATTTPTCTPGCDGTAMTTTSGGVAPYTYTISGGAVVDPLGNASGLCAGTIYTITVTDANACTADITVQLIAPNSPTLTLGATTDPTCTPGCDGTAMTTTSGGVAPFTYTISGGAVVDPLGNASGLCAGTIYTITVTDANACTADITVQLIAPNSPTLTLGATTDPTCTPGCDGTAMTTTSGGVAPYTYTISGGAVVDALGNASGLCAGTTYTITVTDANACTADITVQLIAPNSPTLTLGATTDPTCTPGCDGTAMTTTSGGVAPFTYTISGGAVVDALGNASGLCAGTIYTITVTDANACTADITVQLIAPNSPTLTLGATTDPTCTPGCDGTAMTTTSGGVAPYTYTISGGAVVDALGNASGLCAGTIYTITVTDANACTADITVQLIAPNSPTLTLGATTDPTCTPGCDGTAMTTTSGGVAPFTYTISGGAVVDALGNASGLCAGTIYTITVTDANACTADVTVQLIAPNSPTLTLGATTDPTCTPGCDGTAMTTTSGGVAPYTYTISGGAVVDPLGNASGLCAGITYTITVTDANGCTADITVLLVAPNSPTLTLGATTDPTCNPGCDGTAMTTTSGGVAPFTYTISGGAVVDALGNASGLCAGTIYTITVTDANACTADVTVQLIAPNSPTLTLGATTDPTCTPGCDGTAMTTTSGGVAPFTYTISGGAVVDALGNASGLCAGTIYTITVTDANACTADVTVLLVAPNSPTLTLGATTDPTCIPGCDGTAMTTTSGGVAPYTYTISGGAVVDPLGNASGLCAGTTYTITVTDANGCTADITVLLVAPNSPTLTLGATTSPTCIPGCDGTAMTTTSGGVAPYTYTISGGAVVDALGNASGLCAGTIYTITVTDANGCTADITVLLIAPNSPTLTLGATTSPTCIPGCDGTAMTTTSGGVAPYTYTISGGAVVDALGNASGLCAGITYTITVTDANGCTADMTVLLVAPSVPTVTISGFTNVTFFGGNDGTITAQAVGGVLPYVYSITPLGPQGPGANFMNLTAQCYTITVTDANGCTATTTQCLTEPAPCNISLSATDENCYMACDGTIVTTQQNCTPPYSYSILPAVAPANGNGLFTGLCPGTYTITVVDGNNATSTSVATIGAATQLVFGQPVIVNPGCTPNNNGSITISANGGAGSIVYSITPMGPQGPGGIFTGLTAQSYTLTATDANGCSISTTVVLTTPNSPSIVMNGVTNITCNGLCNGSSQAVASGGAGGYSYSINVPGVIDVNTGVSTGLCAGSYTVTVVDANGCSATTNFVITEPPVLLIDNITVTHPLCSGQMAGEIVISLAGGAGGYVYSILPVAGVQGPAGTFTGLGAGSYTITGADANGCSVTTIVDIVDPAALVWSSVLGVNISCYGMNDGQITALAGGGTGQITYSILPQMPQPTAGYFSPLTPQCYTVTAIDANGCSITTQVCITEPGPITFNAPIVQDNLCHGGTTGEITVSVTGGTPSFIYTIQPGGQVSNTGQFTGLGAGSYTITVVDTNGCNAVSGAILITDPPAIVFNTVNVHEVYCHGDSTGSIAVIASGGTGAISFSITPNATQDPPGFFKYLLAGSYTITATDGNGCTSTTVAVVNENPKIIVTSVSIVEPICAYDSTGVIQVNGVGGVAPLMYSLNNGVPNLTGTFTGLVIASYKLTLIDNLGCSYDTTIDLTGPTLVGATIQIDPTKCIDSEDGRVFVTGTGGRGGYKYFITPGLHINKSGVFLDLAAGTYTLRVVDTVGCEYQTTIVINPPSNPLWTSTSKQDLGCYGRGDEGSATVIANGGQLPYVYEWSTTPVQNTATASSLYFGWYFVSVTDANGCVERDSVYVSEGPCCEIAFIPSAFSPNGDNQNDEFRVLTTAGVELIQFEVYDRWGQRVWATSDWKRGWDGRIDGGDASVGTYYYVLRYKCSLDGKIYIKKGDVTLVR